MQSRTLQPILLVLGLLAWAGCGGSPGASPRAQPPNDSHKKVAIVPRGAPTTRPKTAASSSTRPASSAQALFHQKCAPCHGNTGEGGVGPPLDTRAARAHFANSKVRMAAFIQANMPFNHPRTLTAGQANALAAYIWKLSAKPGGR